MTADLLAELCRVREQFRRRLAAGSRRAADEFLPDVVVEFARIPSGNRNSGESHYGKFSSAARPKGDVRFQAAGFQDARSEEIAGFRRLWIEARRNLRSLVMSHPAIDFEGIVFVKPLGDLSMGTFTNAP